MLTSLSSSKTEFACIFYDVFDVGGFAGSSRLEVSLLFLLVAVLMLPVVLFPTSLSLLNSELICRSYGSSCFLECGFCQGPSGSTMVPSGSTAEGSQVAVPLRSGSTGGDSAAVLPLAYHVPTASIRGVFFCVGLCGTSLRQYRSLAGVPPFLRGSTARFPLSLSLGCVWSQR